MGACFSLLGSGRGRSAAPVPDAGALIESGAPWVGRIAPRPLYAARYLFRAVVVDKAFPAVCQERCRNSIQLLRLEGAPLVCASRRVGGVTHPCRGPGAASALFMPPWVPW